ncbi:MAG: site-2 protease family protein, partial [Hadesarchaea archaeon]
WGALINLWLAFFNLLPFPPLDGEKVFLWSPAAWAAIEVPLLVSIVMLF